jgi:N-methylhydantoinase A/oxoprolinase/acetone carboxylase beta subunit
MSSFVRIGIDVGGTFTHAVALDGTTLEIIGKSKVPTTHRSAQGVAQGIIESLAQLLQEAKISPESVRFIAHSTTQATNALLEGDVAPVGIIGMGTGWLAKSATNIRGLELAPGKVLKTYHRFIETKTQPSLDQIKSAVDGLIADGAKAFAVSEAFAVDSPENEQRVLQYIREQKLPATAGAEISQLYGLKVRTRTAVINASMLPKMIESADMTESSVRQAGIKAPIMIMRSDGGVMDINAMRQRPILTMLSGPAAGVAAAMMYLCISDGIFMEVGGTSTDISAIRNGKALVKSAEIGGHRIYLHTLDVRTVGVAGGSMIRLKGNSLVDTGPRSAHIAGLSYVAFNGRLESPQVHVITPCEGDPNDYVALSASGETKPSVCLTTTCAANLLGFVPEGDCAKGNVEPVKTAFTALADKVGKSAEDTAKDVLLLADKKCEPIVSALIKDYKLDKDLVTLVGGGGGAAAIVPFCAKQMGLRFSLAENADVISAIGVALALVRETVERQIIHPTSDDILRVRQEAFTSVQKMGAEPSTIEVHVEVDSRANVVRATAYGATATDQGGKTKRKLSEDEQIASVAESMRVDKSVVKLVCQTKNFHVFGASSVRKRLGGLMRQNIHQLRTLDHGGTIRLQTINGVAVSTKCNLAEKTIYEIAEEHAQYGDAGKVIPKMMLLAGSKIVDLSGLLDTQQVVALAKIELENLPKDEDVIVVADFS